MLPALLWMVFAQMKPFESSDFPAAAQQRAVAATVRLKNTTQACDGSGVLVGRIGPVVYVLTAAHIADKDDKLTISVFTKDSYPRSAHEYPGELIARQDEQDLAIIRFTTSDELPSPARPYPPAKIPDAKDFPGLTVGCNDGGAPTCLAVVVAGKKRVRRRADEGTALVWEIKSAPKTGRSGGPLLDREGRLLGVCSGAAADKGYYAHAEAIYAFLKQNALEVLADEEPKK